MALGTGLSKILALTGITFPTYFGSLLTACFMRNVFGLAPKWEKELCIGEVVSIGDICLQLFLGMAMANMSAVCYKYRYAVQPFIIVPIIGAMFVDLINTGVITLFLNMIQ